MFQALTPDVRHGLLLFVLTVSAAAELHNAPHPFGPVPLGIELLGSIRGDSSSGCQLHVPISLFEPDIERVRGGVFYDVIAAPLSTRSRAFTGYFNPAWNVRLQSLRRQRYITLAPGGTVALDEGSVTPQPALSVPKPRSTLDAPGPGYREQRARFGPGIP